MKDQALHPCPAQGLNHTTDPVMYQPCTTDLHEAVSDEPLAATRSRPQSPRGRGRAIADVLLRELGLLPDGD